MNEGNEITRRDLLRGMEADGMTEAYRWKMLAAFLEEQALSLGLDLDVPLEEIERPRPRLTWAQRLVRWMHSSCDAKPEWWEGMGGR